MFRIGPPQPNVLVRERISVGPFARQPPLLPEPHRDEAPTPSTQTLAPSRVIEADVIHVPLVRRLIPKGKIPDATNTEIKKQIAGMKRAAKHAAKDGGEDRKAGLHGYSPAEQWALLMRAGEGQRTTEEAVATKLEKRQKERTICEARWDSMTVAQIKQRGECQAAAKVVWKKLNYSDKDNSFGELAERVGVLFRKDYLNRRSQE